MKSTFIYMLLCTFSLFAPNSKACFFFLASTAHAQITVPTPFAFTTLNPPISAHMGFDAGQVLAVGAFVSWGDDEIIEAYATNLESGAQLTLANMDSLAIFSGLYESFPNPTFIPEKHLGAWKLTFVGASGDVVTAVTQPISVTETMPLVKGVKAEGDPLAPVISWKAVKENQVPDKCRVTYELRLLEGDIDLHFYRSPYFPDPVHEIPAGLINEEKLPRVWVRTMAWCIDTATDHPVAFETRSNSFQNLLELYYNDDYHRRYREGGHR